MIYHLFFSMMHFLANALLRWTQKQRVKIVPTQHFGLEHRDHQGGITPFTGQFDLLLRAGRGNFGNLYCFKIQVLSPGWRSLGGLHTIHILRKSIQFMNVKDLFRVLKLLHQFSDGLLLIWR